MPYIPYWFEPFLFWTPWMVPTLAILGLWIARLCEDSRVKSAAECCYFGAMVVAAMITLRTILADDGCWLLHTTSFGLMVVGAIFPHHTNEPSTNDGLGGDLGGYDVGGIELPATIPSMNHYG